MIRFAFVAVFVGCGTPDIGDPISCPDCRPGDLFATRFLEVPSLTIAGTPMQVVYGHEYDFEDGPKPATYGDLTPRNGVMLGALAP